jgi:hypothetical protein
MKNSGIFLLLISAVFLLAACQSKTTGLLSKKWNYAKIDNVDSVDKKYQSPEDSVANANTQKAMQLLSWTFKKDYTYACTVNDRVATSGTYELTDNETYLELTPASKTATISYKIKTLTENELVLSSSVNNVSVTMYFTATN